MRHPRSLEMHGVYGIVCAIDLGDGDTSRLTRRTFASDHWENSPFFFLPEPSINTIQQFRRT